MLPIDYSKITTKALYTKRSGRLLYTNYTKRCDFYRIEYDCLLSTFIYVFIVFFYPYRGHDCTFYAGSKVDI